MSVIKDLLARVEQEEREGDVSSIEHLSADLRADLEKAKVMGNPDQGLDSLKAYLKSVS